MDNIITFILGVQNNMIKVGNILYKITKILCNNINNIENENVISIIFVC